MKDQTSIFHTFNQFLYTLKQANTPHYTPDGLIVVAAILAHAQVTQSSFSLESVKDIIEDLKEQAEIQKDTVEFTWDDRIWTHEGRDYKVWIDHKGPFWDEFFFYTFDKRPRKQSGLYQVHPDETKEAIEKGWITYTTDQKLVEELHKWNSEV